MKTITKRVPLIKQERKGNYIFLLDDLELTMHKDQLERVTNSWKKGDELEVIAATEERSPIEVLLALMHQARKGYKLPAFASVILRD